MSDQTRPNLFHYATSELSQDAFICWLAAWADPKYKDDDNHALHQAGTNFIRSMIAKKPDCDVTIIKAVKVRRQVGKLDVLIEINKNPDADESKPGELAILVEDKTHTDHHSGQLERYYENAIKDYTSEQIIPIYFKTGYQSRFDVGVYKTYLREDFLERLRSGRESVKNAIYHDFLAHLENMENVVQQFSMKTPTDWQDNDWRGFFMNLYKSRNQFYDVTESDGANWNYVANPSGGFFGFWWYFRPKLVQPPINWTGIANSFAMVSSRRNPVSACF